MTNPVARTSCLTALALACLVGPAAAQGIVSHIADGTMNQYAEGVLRGHVVQGNGATICEEPYAIGIYISCAPEITLQGETFGAIEDNDVWVSTSGFLEGYKVLDADGEIVCSSPTTYPHFRGPTSYLWCN